MKVQFGAFITSAKGKIAGFTMSSNHNGHYLKKKGKPINRKTAAQTAVRNGFSTISKGWAALTESVRSAYRTNTANFPKKDSLAQTQQLTGAQLYMRLNRNLQAIGQAVITVFPGLRTIASAATASVAAAAGAGTMALTYSPTIPATDSWIVRASAPVSPGKSSGEQNFKQIGVLVTAEASPYAIKTLYEAVYGTSWKVAGAKIFFQVHPIGTAEGFAGSVNAFSTIVAA